ncbi:aspartyl/asparaginyl beta-hydroxylase isoform X4 [Rhagoletis pomonella]|uniref:aspartyl/asparaginyl beta-hydroxylase isoform X4 n=1 Tax=Rhagoletis pomonella TaxID=28610 RepID=UPI00177C2DFA|nr:aspartyl/asparaginyl beta-hydroxylase isoform X4 [Rhagoletis pomonella]
MSGDVQPRKRKDKKKRRDDESSHGVHITKMGNEDVHLHVQHDHGTGGHWCAKIFFFSLLAILFGLVGLIILENRGISDLDTPLSESRFSNYFDGWVDESRQDHDDHDPVQASIEKHEEHDEPFEEEEDHSELDEEADEEHDEDEAHDGDHDEEDENATTEQTKELEEDEDNDEEDGENEDDDEADDEDATKEATLERTNEEDDDDDENDNDNDNNKEEEDDDDDDDDKATQEATTKEEEEDEADAEGDNNEEEEDDEEQNNTNEQTAEASQEANEADDNDDDENASNVNDVNDENDDEDDDDDDDEGDDDIEPIYERSAQQQTKSERSQANNANDNDDDDDDYEEDDDDDDTFNSIENVVDNDAEELLLLQEKARQQAAQAAKSEPASAEKVDKEDAAEAVPSWASSQIKPKEAVGGGPQAHNDDYDLYERELRRANEEMLRENYAEAVKGYGQLAQRYPDKPQAFLGQANALDKLAELQRSNHLLSEALQAYKRYLALGSAITNNAQFRAAAERCIERMRFMGHHMQAVPIHQQLIERFADEPDVRNQLAITYLLQNRLSDAKLVLQEVLRRWPQDGFAQVHYGFVLRQLDKDYENAVIYLREGIKSNASGTQDGRFYFNLGDSLQRLGRQAEAVEVYKRGAALKLFPSAYQRALYNEPNLRAKPFWTKAETTYVSYLNELELNWRAIRDEALSLLGRRGYFIDEAESLRDTGNWQQFELYARGQRRVENCQKAPITCGLIKKFSAAASCRRGQVKFSVMQPGTHVHAHCGPTNCRLRAHLGLVVPSGTRLRVAEEERTWIEGEFLIFDDSFEHEVWHNGSSFRLVLIVDVWHPDLSVQQRRTLTPI